MNHKQNCLSYWFPLIEAAGLPVPKTIILPAPESIGAWAYGEGQPPEAFFDSIARAGKEIGWPVFIRSGQTSAKHSWKDSCFLPDSQSIPSHVRSICEYSELCCLSGIPYDVFAVRQFLKAAPRFHAFNEMPITREFRFFVRDGVIEHVQPYWPPEAIDGNTEDAEWASKLAEMNKITPEEMETLSRLSLKANAVVPGFWSIDWLETEDGWFLTDMALGEESFRWGD